MTGSRDGMEPRPLSPGLAAALRDALGLRTPPRSLAEVLPEPVQCDVETLFSPEPTGHRVRAGKRSGHLKCALDAFFLAFLQDEPVELRSASPISGAEVRAAVTRRGVRLSHRGAVLSLAAGAGPAACLCVRCPDVHLFPSRREYERWAATEAGAGTVPLPAAAAWELARALLEEPSLCGDQEQEVSR